MTPTWYAALIAAAHEFPIGSRVVATDGNAGTVVYASKAAAYNSENYQMHDSAFVRPEAYRRGLGGPYIAVQLDGHESVSDRCAHTLVKADIFAEIEEVPPNVTVVVTVIVNS